MDFVRKWAGWIAALVLMSLLLLQVPRGVFFLAIAAGAGGLYWLIRRNGKIQARDAAGRRDAPAPPLNKDPDSPDPGALARRSLHQIQDVRLAGVVLMIQLVRTGAPLTAAEKNVIYDLMADPLGIEDRQAMFEAAWQLTDRGRVFSPVADDLAPLLASHLTMDERLEFIGMLSKVANAEGMASDLQKEAIVRLKRRLTTVRADDPRP
ncbi:hypothetical protein LMIY3S_03492 [Labrys miyagiensis]